MHIIAFFAICVAVVAGAPSGPDRIQGGTLATINQYPSIANVEFSRNFLPPFYQQCGGIIINNRSILTAAHCLIGTSQPNWRIRVGSAFASSGGTVHNALSLILHQNFIPFIQDSDIAIIRTVTTITPINNAVAVASIAGANYNVADNQIVTAAGWGSQYYSSQPSEQLRHVQLSAINQNTCRTNWATRNRTITDNMICAGHAAGGRDQCLGDAGGPLYHNNIVVGVASWNVECNGVGVFPAVNTRVSRFTAWIQANA